MPKTSHGFTLWAVPRFHRQDISGARQSKGEQLDFHSYVLLDAEEEDVQFPEQGRQEETTRH